MFLRQVVELLEGGGQLFVGVLELAIARLGSVLLLGFGERLVALVRHDLAPGLDAGSAAYSFGLIGSSDNQSAGSVFAGRGFLLTEGANAAGAAAIVASAVIGPPVGLRSGPLSASDW